MSQKVWIERLVIVQKNSCLEKIIFDCFPERTWSDIYHPGKLQGQKTLSQEFQFPEFYQRGYRQMIFV